jgi:acrylyl-CoA reductase (NADPH)
MPIDTFRALVIDQRNGETHSSIQSLRTASLPEGDVLVSVAFSDLNYKDGLAVTGRGRVVRSFPMVPGIDFAGTVVESNAPAFKPGDQVVLTGWGVGERHWGGYAQMARVKADWLVRLPEGLSLQQAMGIGTAGFTAMLCVMALEERGLTTGGREVLVTGATGGVGSIAVAILANLGYNVVASTGKTDAHEYLKGLGARQILNRSTLDAPSGKPLESERWGGAVDTVGGATLAALLPAMAYGAAVATCGNAGGAELRTTVFPFILRGVSLVGIESVMCPPERRHAAWARLTADLPLDALDRMIQVAPLKDVPALSHEILEGRIRGRIVVDVNQI